MRDLTDLTGEELDQAFLEEHDEVADLARTIRTDRMREIRWMRARSGAGAWPGCPAGLR